MTHFCTAFFDITCCIRYNINWNYGLLPQTWEDPTSANSDVEGAFGDNDPGNEHFYLLPLTNMVFILPSLSINLYFLWFSFPVDVVEIGERRANIGDVLKVKPLAALAMIDEGELDWKIVAISLDDPKASLVNDVDDVEKHFPV
jgi:inorganic pyrophosphatase